MALKTINFHVLNVGQGTGNFIECCDGKGNVLNAILIDFGSERDTGGVTSSAVAWVAERLETMAKPTIDAVIFSHSDSDHINLVPDLLKDHFPNHGDLAVNNTYYGGSYAKYAKKGENVLYKLEEEYMKDELESFPKISTNYTNLKKKDPVPFYSNSYGVEIYLLIGNVPGASAANTASLVLAVNIKGTYYIVTGDATGVTIAELNDIINFPNFRQKYLGDNVWMLTTPHHGSRTTMLNIAGVGGKANAEKNLQDFAGCIKPKSVTNSADKIRRFKHPSAYVLQFFWPYLASTALYTDPDCSGGHYYMAYFTGDEFQIKEKGSLIDWPSSEWWHSVQSQYNIYTNLYYEDPPDYDPAPTSKKRKRSSAPPKIAVLPLLPGSFVDGPDPGDLPPSGVNWQYSCDVASNKTILIRWEYEDDETGLSEEIHIEKKEAAPLIMRTKPVWLPARPTPVILRGLKVII
jgi:beta-lactamase superfamily II metal-dependent hydrolase